MRSEHTSNNTETIIAEIKTDNQDGKGADITSWDNINVSVTLNGTNISINIVANENNLNYKGNVRWSAKYVPTKTDLASLSWKMRPLYTSNVVNTIKSTITSDNSGISGVANLTYNITVNGSYIGISIYAPDSNTTYKGGVQWSARYSASDVYVTGSAHNVAYKAYTASSGGSTVDTGQGWWRTWSDGVIEQGGILSVPATEAYITLMKNYTSVNNMVVLATSSATSSPVMGKANAYNQVKIDFDGQITGLASWYCIGW